jgi:hypothetical protein
LGRGIWGLGRGGCEEERQSERRECRWDRCRCCVLTVCGSISGAMRVGRGGSVELGELSVEWEWCRRRRISIME